MRRWIATILLTAIIASPLIIPQALKRFRTDHVRTDVSLYVGDKNVFGFLDKVETASQTIGSSGITDNSITSNDLTTALLQFVGSGGNVQNFPDDSTLGALPDSTLYIKDNAIRLAHLGNEVRNWIQNSQTSNNLYDYQDASINSALQMHVRWIHYWFDRYYTNTDTTLTYEYDASGRDYVGERRGITAYISLLKALHQETGDSRYWNLMVDLVNKMRGTRITVPHNVTGGRTAYTYGLHSNTSWYYWSKDDCRMYRVLYYMYQQDPVTYAAYLTEIKNFADVAYSYISKQMPGWGWAYSWNGDLSAASADNQIYNTTAPFMPFYAMLKTNSITTTDITTTATYDTLLDSTFHWFEQGWIPAGTGGGWEYAASNDAISTNYLITVMVDMMEAAEILSDTAFADSLTTRLQGVIDYMTNPTGSNYNKAASYWSPGFSLIFKWGEKYGMTFAGDSLKQAWVANFLYPAAYTGNQIDGRIGAGDPRRLSSYYVAYMPQWIEYFNNNGFTDTWVNKRKHTTDAAAWNTNASSYYAADGAIVYQGYGFGVGGASGLTPVVYYRHGDSSPLADDPDTCAYNSATHVVTLKVPRDGTGNLSNGLKYTGYKKLGTPYLKIVPTAADSIWILVDDPGDATGDSTYLFYYNAGGVLDTLKNSTLAVGDSISFNPSRGIMAQVVRTSAPAAGYSIVGYVGNRQQAWLKCTASGASNKRYSLSATTLMDSAMVFGTYHQVGDWFFDQADATGWDQVFDAAEDMLNAARLTWENGFSWDGILEDKTQ